MSDAEGELHSLTHPGVVSHDDVLAAARAKLLTARELLAELNAMLAAAELEQASAAVANAERNLTMVLEELLAPTRTTIATAAVLEALRQLDTAKLRLGEIQELARTRSE